MVALGVGLLAACFVLAVANGIRMIRDDGTGHMAGPATETGGTGGTDESVGTDAHRREGVFVRFIDALGLRGQQVLRRLYGPVRLSTLNQRLRSAGNPEGLHLDLFIQREAGFVLLSTGLLLVFVLLDQPVLGVVIAIIFSGWMQLWLAQSLRGRQRRINQDLPDFLDILAVAVRSGLPFRNALERVCERFEGPVPEEMTTALHEMRLGVSRRDAFSAVRRRSRSDSIDTFVTALLQSEELGTPIGDALQAIVKEIRRERAEQVRRDAAKASPKVSLVATMTMLPGTIILMTGGMLYANRDVFARIFGG